MRVCSCVWIVSHNNQNIILTPCARNVFWAQQLFQRNCRVVWSNSRMTIKTSWPGVPGMISGHSSCPTTSMPPLRRALKVLSTCSLSNSCLSVRVDSTWNAGCALDFALWQPINSTFNPSAGAQIIGEVSSSWNAGCALDFAHMQLFNSAFNPSAAEHGVKSAAPWAIAACQSGSTGLGMQGALLILRTDPPSAAPSNHLQQHKLLGRSIAVGMQGALLTLRTGSPSRAP